MARNPAAARASATGRSPMAWSGNPPTSSTGSPAPRSYTATPARARTMLVGCGGAIGSGVCGRRPFAEPLTGDDGNAVLQRPVSDDGRSDTVRVILPAATVVRLILAGVGLVLAIHLINAIQGVLIWSLAALFLALAMEPAIRFAERRGLKRSTATVTVYAGGVLAVLGVLAAVLIPLASQTRSLIDDGPRIVDRIERASVVQDLDRRFHVLKSVHDIPTHVPDAAGLLFGLTGTVFGLVFGTVTVVFLAVFASIELPRMVRGGL